MKYEYFESNDEIRESLVRYMTNHHLIFQTYPSPENVNDVRSSSDLKRLNCLYSHEEVMNY